MTERGNIPQGYKYSKLGIIPCEWHIETLGAICYSICSGKNKTKSTEGEYPVYGSTGIIGYTNQYVYNRPLILIARVGANAGKVNKVDGFFDVSDNTLIIDVRPIIHYLFLYDLLQMSSLNRLVFGSGQPLITAGTLRLMQVALPPIEEQKKIAEVLSGWDKAIELQTKLIEKLELRKRALMQCLLTGRVRLNGFGGKWEKVKAGEVFYNSSKRSTIGEQLLSATQEYGIIPRDMLDTRVTMPSENSVENFKLVEQGDFVISLRSFQGGIEYSHYRGCISPAYTVLKNKHTINDTFYQYYFKSTDFICRLAVAVIGIRDGRQISFNDFCYVKIPEPSLSEQIAIAEVLVIADKEIEIAKTKLSSFSNQKRGLMQQLLTGKKRIMSSPISN